MQTETHMIATCKETASNGMGEVFTKGQEYKCRAYDDRYIMIRDNFGAYRNFHDWTKDKFLKEMFIIKEAVKEEE